MHQLLCRTSKARLQRVMAHESLSKPYLHGLWRRVVVVVVRLVVLVPLIPGVHAIEVLGLPRLVLLVPPEHLRQNMEGAFRTNSYGHCLCSVQLSIQGATTGCKQRLRCISTRVTPCALGNCKRISVRSHLRLDLHLAAKCEVARLCCAAHEALRLRFECALCSTAQSRQGRRQPAQTTAAPC